MVALPAHALLETYSVLTRLPGGLAMTGPGAAELLATRFPGTPMELPTVDRGRLIPTLADAGVLGGASYDGLVALEAAAHGHELITLDRRARETYRQLGVRASML